MTEATLIPSPALEGNREVASLDLLNVDAMARGLLEAELTSSKRNIAALKEEFWKSKQVIETLRAALEAFVKAESDIEVSAAIEYDRQLEAAYQLALAALSDNPKGESNAQL